jgi:hypothetical protein
MIDLKNLHVVGFEANGEVAIHRWIVEKVGFYDFGLIAEAKNKGLKTVVGVRPHDVPKNGVIANGHHGFWAGLGFLTQARAEPTTEDKDRNFGGLQGRNLLDLRIARSGGAWLVYTIAGIVVARNCEAVAGPSDTKLRLIALIFGSQLRPVTGPPATLFALKGYIRYRSTAAGRPMYRMRDANEASGRHC